MSFYVPAGCHDVRDRSPQTSAGLDIPGVRNFVRYLARPLKDCARAATAYASMTVRLARWRSGVMPLLIVILVGFLLAGYLAQFPARFCDFRAFYCSGRVILDGRDPYREHPLHECELSLPGPFVSSLPAEVTIPAPYPGYALALFSAVARLPFNAAVIAWTFGSCVLLGASVFLVSRLTATPLYASALALGFPALIVPLPLGQPTLFVLFAIVSSAALLRANQPRLAALAALTTAIEPQVGLAVCLGLFVAVRQTRFVLLGGAAALLTWNTLGFGIAREWEYVHDVLPLHALVNVPEFSQFSAANLAFTAGLDRHLALAVGNVSYAVFLVAGLIAGRSLRTRYGLAAAAIVPVAFAVCGGAHTHLQQLALGIPALLLVTSAAAGRRRVVLVTATFAACVPWLIAAPFPYLFLATGVLGVVFARLMGCTPISLALGAGSLLLFVLLGLAVAHAHLNAGALQSVRGNPLAEAAWGAYVDRTSLPAQAWYLAAKLPTFLGYLLTLAMLLGETPAQRRATSAETSPHGVVAPGSVPA